MRKLEWWLICTSSPWNGWNTYKESSRNQSDKRSTHLFEGAKPSPTPCSDSLWPRHRGEAAAAARA